MAVIRLPELCIAASAPAGGTQASSRAASVLLISFCAAAPLASAPNLAAQRPSAMALNTPAARHPEPFTRVAGVRELADGRVIVLDSRERRVVVVDMKSGEIHRIGQTGRGPGEYQMPRSLWPLPGDSSIVFDLASRAGPFIITPRATIAGILRIVDSHAGGRVWMVQDATDQRGRLYSQVPLSKKTAIGEIVSTDSGGIERFDRSNGHRDTVAFISVRSVPSGMQPNRAGRPIAATGQRPTDAGVAPPFAARDQWAVAADGRVAIASPDPYRVTFVDTNGIRKVSKPFVVDRVPVTEAHKKLWREERQQPVAAMVFRGEGVTAQFMRVPYAEPEAWPARLPPFLNHAVSFAPDGMLWIQRTTAAESSPLFDIVDREGRLVARLTAPRRSRLVGFGAAAVYIVRIDDDDLEYLERFPLPRR